MLHDDSFECPPRYPPRQLRTRFGRQRRVAPEVTAPDAALAAHDHFQQGRASTERLVRQPADFGVAPVVFAATASAPAVRLDDTAGDNCSVGLEALPGRIDAAFIESEERGQVRAGEARRRGNVGHDEIFRVAGAGTSIVKRP